MRTKRRRIVAGVFKYGLDKEIRSRYNIGICFENLPDIDNPKYDKYIHQYVYAKVDGYHYFLFRPLVRQDFFRRYLERDGAKIIEYWLNPDFNRNAMDRDKKKFLKEIENYLDKPYTYALY